MHWLFKTHVRLSLRVTRWEFSNIIKHVIKRPNSFSSTIRCLSSASINLVVLVVFFTNNFSVFWKLTTILLLRIINLYIIVIYSIVIINPRTVWLPDIRFLLIRLRFTIGHMGPKYMFPDFLHRLIKDKLLTSLASISGWDYHRIIEVSRDLLRPSDPTPCRSRGSCSRLSRTMPSQVLRATSQRLCASVWPPSQ